MSALLPDYEKSFLMGCTLRRSIRNAKSVSELRPPPPPPNLVSPSEGELLTLYLEVSNFSTSTVLIRDKDQVQNLVYYCSQALRGAEERYPKMEKLVLALVTTARKLNPYFQAHTIEIPTEYPMKQVLHKPETSGRLMKWAIGPSEFDIKYKPKTTIKGQILADFVMEFTSSELAEDAQTTPDLPVWNCP